MSESVLLLVGNSERRSPPRGISGSPLPGLFRDPSDDELQQMTTHQLADYIREVRPGVLHRTMYASLDTYDRQTLLRLAHLARRDMQYRRAHSAVIC